MRWNNTHRTDHAATSPGSTARSAGPAPPCPEVDPAHRAGSSRRSGVERRERVGERLVLPQRELVFLVGGALRSIGRLSSAQPSGAAATAVHPAALTGRDVLDQPADRQRARPTASSGPARR